ncbi:MucBP domain-containing protein, partial [Vagococcus elongatus]
MKRKRKFSVLLLLVLLFYMLTPNISLATDTDSQRETKLTITHIEYDKLTQKEKESVTLDKSETLEIKNTTDKDMHLTVVYSKMESPKKKTDNTTLQKLLPKTGAKKTFSILIGIVFISFSLLILIKRKQLGKSKFFIFLLLLGTGLIFPNLNVRFSADTDYLLDTEAITLNKDEKFIYNIPKIEGYEKIGHILNQDTEDQTVPPTPIKQMGEVKVNYLDTAGKPIYDSSLLKGEVGELYQTEQKEFPGYKFVEVKGAPASGEFKPENQTVTYVYQQQGTVTVRYVDTEDKELTKPITLTGGVNEPYDTAQKEFSGYKFVEVKGAPAAGEFKPESQTVT